MISENLLRACEVVERGSVTESLRSILFIDGRVRAFNGVYEYQAPSGLSPTEHFAVAEAKLSAALRACGPVLEISTTPDFLRLKQGPLSVRVRKLDPSKIAYEPIVLSPTALNQNIEGLQESLAAVTDFVSTDASRPWSVAVLIKDGYAWATNNLALVRSPLAVSLPEMRIPGGVVPFLCALPDIQYYDIDERSRLVFSWTDQLVRCPQSAAQWPDLAKYFENFPAKLDEVGDDMRVATKTVERFADRFIKLNVQQIESKTTELETEYEVAFDKGAGLYSARLLALIITHATHADFSFYPKPVYFKGPRLEGTAIGAQQA